MVFSESAADSDREGSVAATQLDTDEDHDDLGDITTRQEDISRTSNINSIENESMISTDREAARFAKRETIIPSRQHLLSMSGDKENKPYSAQEVDARVILHIDCNTFFLAVHKLYDNSLHNAGPLVLWQYNDVICVSPEAKKAGVRKHMRPTEAQPLVDEIGGQMVHAFTRRWPGPRCWYGPYQKVSRDVFDRVRQVLSETIHSHYVFERASIDEAYIDISEAASGSLEFGASLARRLVVTLEQSVGIHASVGVARNRLMAKLASSKAKPPSGDGLLVTDGEDDPSFAALLQSTPASKLPGFGGKASEFSTIGVDTVADLQRHTAEELQLKLNLTAPLALRLSQLCCGLDSTSVQVTSHKKSISVSSWLTDASLGNLALKHHIGLGGEAVVIGDGWIFEPHAEKSVTNSTRVRWLLLALILDLDERVVEEFLEFAHLPTKVTVSFQGPGWRKEPGPGSTDGHSRSRSCDFPFSAFATISPSDTRSAKVSTLSAPRVSDQVGKSQAHVHSVYGTPFLGPGSTSSVQGLADGLEVLQDARYCKRITALVNCIASLIRKWATEGQNEIKIAHLALSARAMIEHRTSKCEGYSQSMPKRLAQRTLHEVFKRPKKCVKTSAYLTPCIDIADSD